MGWIWDSDEIGGTTGEGVVFGEDKNNSSYFVGFDIPHQKEEKKKNSVMVYHKKRLETDRFLTTFLWNTNSK